MTAMFIIYTSPSDGLTKARRVTNFRDAGILIATLERMGVAAKVEEEIKLLHSNNLPLIAQTWAPNFSGEGL